MSQLGQFNFEEGIETLTGNSGDIVHPQVGNVNIRGADHVTVVGNNTTATLSIYMDGEIADTYTTDSGNAVPAVNILRVLGGDNINTAGATNAVTIHLDTSIVQPVTSADGLSGLYSLGSNRFMHARGTDNTFLGDQAGSLGLTVATAVGNTGIGSAVLTGITSAAYNVGVGASALTLVTTGVANTAVGALAGSLMNGSGNTLLGKEAGISYTGTESYNIVIGNSGTVGESNKIRIGGAYGTGANQQDTAYITGMVHGSNGLTADLGDIICTAGNITASAGNISATAGYIETVDNDLYIGDKTVAITGPDLQFKKSRNGAVITSGDVLGNIKFSGHDGTSYDVAAQITSLSSGTIGTGRIAADLQFWTSPDIAGIALRRMDVKPTGEVYIYSPDSGVGLTIQSRGETITAGDLELTNGNVIVGNTAVSSDGGDINFKKSRSGGTVVTADNLGNLVYWGHDGTSDVLAAAVISNTSGTIATGRVPANLEFWTHPDSVVACTQRMVVGTTGSVTINAPDSGNALNSYGLIAAFSSSADHIANDLDFKKSRSGGVITTGDELGNITFQGHDGTNYVVGAAIIADTNGTIATNRIPTQLQFWTHPDSAVAALQRLTIASTGGVTIASPDSGVGLTVSGGGETISSGNLSLTSGNLALPTTSSTVGQITVNGIKAIHFYGTDNIFMGNAGNFTTSGSGTNIGLGTNSLVALTTGQRNICFGVNSGYKLTDGSFNCVWGVSSLYNATSSVLNLAIGYSSLYSATTGDGNNVAIGTIAGWNLTTGAHNVLIGGTNNYPTNTTGTGSAYTSSESSNILIHNVGVVGESNKIRIGTAGTGVCQQDACYIAGIYGVTPGGTVNAALVDSNGQLGSVASLGVANGGTGAATLTDHGILLGSGTGAITPLSVGSSGQILTGVTSDDPTWTTATYPSTVSKGDVLVASADNVIGVVTGAATAGYVLTANGAGSAPTFQANSGGGIATLNGDSGSATGSTVTLEGGTGITTSGTSATITISSTKTTCNTQTDSYALVIGDAGKFIIMNKASANTLTVPKNSAVAFATGTIVAVVQYGAGATTIAPVDGDVTLRSKGSALQLYAQYSTATLVKIDTDEWIVSGDLV